MRQGRGIKQAPHNQVVCILMLHRVITARCDCRGLNEEREILIVKVARNFRHLFNPLSEIFIIKCNESETKYTV
jgi:hypothetical protein